MTRSFALLAMLFTLVKPAFAEPPAVVTDIGPVHSLTAMVMHGVGEPQVVIPPGASPHDFALRPSDARNLSRAEAVIWISEDLTPSLARSIASLASSAVSLELLKSPGTFSLPYREGSVFSHDANGEHDDHDNHDDRAGHEKHDDHMAHDDHDDHGHKDGEHHKAHAGHGHDHDSEVDLHAWHDPENAKTWLTTIAELLSDLDAENEATYRANAASSIERISALEANLRIKLAPLQGKGFIVTHDAFHYFEHRFGIEAVGALSAGDAKQASAARLQQVTAMLKETGPVCIFVEPQTSDALARTFAAEHDGKVGTLDPLGDTFARGADQYLQMLEGIANGLIDCLS